PDLAHASGVSPTPVTSDAPLPTFADGRQEFRFRLPLSDATFAATRSVRKREVVYEVATQMFLDGKQLRATQTIGAGTGYQPLGQLTLDVPEGWSLVGDHVQITASVAQPEISDENGTRREANGEELATDQTILVPASNEGMATDHGTRLLIVSLPQPRLG